jgi:hypothetical protein
MSSLRPAILSVLLAVLPARDLDVGVPPGSPLEWTRAFPARTPEGTPLFPESGSEDEEPGRTVASSALPEQRGSSAFGLVRILTWDLAAHVDWIETLPALPSGPATGSARLAPPPTRPGDALYWVTIAPLLRLLLHPQAVSRAGTLAHLVEIGEPALVALSGAATEAGLAEAVAHAEGLIRPRRDGFPRANPTESPGAALRARWALEELLGAHPHDPAGVFGARLFLFGSEFEPEVKAYLDAENALLRRNATAALARYASRDAARALAASAAASDDPVVLVRACAGIGAIGYVPNGPEAAALVERLGRASEPVELAALIGATGRARLEAAVPRLLELGSRGLAGDSDLLVAVLAALVDLRPRRERDAALAFAREVLERAKRTPKTLAVTGLGTSLLPDHQDPIETRAAIAGQLALVLLAHLEPGRPEHGRNLLGLRKPSKVDSSPLLALAPADALGAVQPPVRFQYLEALGALGERGHAALTEIARDRETEALLRSTALAVLPAGAGEALALKLLDDPSESLELRLQVLELAASRRYAGLEKRARAMLAEHGKIEPEAGAAEARYALLLALRTLSDLGVLRLEDASPLLAHVRAERNAFDRLPEELAVRVRTFATHAAQGAQEAELDLEAEALVAFVIRHRMNPDISESSRASAAKELRRLAQGARAQAANGEYHELLVQSLLDFLLGYPGARLERSQGEFEPVVALEVEVLFALARTREPGALELLLGVLGNRKNRYRGEACLALGILGHKGAGHVLATFLIDGERFVRYCAARALAQLGSLPPNLEAFDWMYATVEERGRAAEEVLRWQRARR